MNKFLKLIITAVVLTFVNSVMASNPYTLKLKSGPISIKAQTGNQNLSDFTNADKSSYAIIQFYKVPNEEEKSRIQANGINLLEYLPNLSYLVFIENPTNETFKTLNIRAIITYKKEYKYAPNMGQKDIPEWAKSSKNNVELMIEPHLNVDPIQFVQILERNNIQINSIDPSNTFYTISIDQSKIETLAKLESVKFIDYIPAPPEKEDDRGRSLHRGNLLDSDSPLGRKYDGTGVSIAIADDGLIGPHIDYTGRVTQFVSFDNGTHGDMTTGIAMGAGNLDPSIRGAATGAYLYYYNISGYPHISNAVSNLNTRGVVITSTSYSEGCNAGYTSTTRVVDQQTRQNPTLLHVFSAGNSSSSTCGLNAYGAGTPWGTITGGRKQGKSTITVGNLSYTGTLTASSSRGPASDGRIKPDICSNGTNQLSTDPNNNYAPGGGTSAAAPGIAGLSAQLYHGYRSLNNNTTPESGLIKSIMLNTARNLGYKGPDYYYGWGRVNVHRAMKLLEESRYLDSNISTNNTNIHTINIPTDLLELRFMVYWTDYEASTIASQALVNDIDIQVVTPSGDTISPWILDPTPIQSNLISPARKGIDTLNNMEQVLIDSAKSGNYQIIINGTTIPQGPQKYFLSWETKPDEVEVTYPSGGESLIPGNFETIRWDATGENGGFLVEYSVNGGTTWNTVGVTSGSVRYRDWFVPNSITGNALIKVSRTLGSSTFGAIDSSDIPFSIIGTPQNIIANSVCFDSIAISWDSVPGATSYEISMLGNKYMDSIGRSNSTNFLIQNTTHSEDNWVSVKALGNGIIGQRANAVLLPKGLMNCDFKIDLGIEKIISPDTNYIFSCGNRDFPVTLEVKNYGDSSISRIPVQYTLNGISYRDTILSTLMKDSSITFTFKDSINRTINGPIILDVRSVQLGDENNTNDSLVNNFEILSISSVSLPHHNNFDSISTCATTSNCGGTVCSLNSGWLNMTNSTYDVFDMRINNGPSPSASTGPSSDHTTGTTAGNYIYAEASNNCYEAESHVVSPCIKLANTVKPELNFWYHMYGITTGSLSVDVYSEGTWKRNIITPISGNKGNSWLNQSIDLSSFVGQSVNIRFRIKTGTSYFSDIALDDINIQELSTGLTDNSSSTILKVYPNPTDELVNIELNTIPKEPILVYDVNGREVIQLRPNSNNFTIDVSSLENGIYFILIKNTQIRQKLIVY